MWSFPRDVPSPSQDGILGVLSKGPWAGGTLTRMPPVLQKQRTFFTLLFTWHQPNKTNNKPETAFGQLMIFWYWLEGQTSMRTMHYFLSRLVDWNQTCGFFNVSNQIFNVGAFVVFACMFCLNWTLQSPVYINIGMFLRNIKKQTCQLKTKIVLLKHGESYPGLLNCP